jgi:hypothetical protein
MDPVHSLKYSIQFHSEQDPDLRSRNPDLGFRIRIQKEIYLRIRPDPDPTWTWNKYVVK